MVAVVLTVTAILCTPLKSYFFFEREYLDDLRIELPENGGVVVIKEWSFLLGSGTEIYYEKDGEETFISRLFCAYTAADAKAELEKCIPR